MYNSIINLSTEDKLFLSELSVNPVFKNLLAEEIESIINSIQHLDPDEDNFESVYRSMQQMLDFLRGLRSGLDEIYKEFYEKPQQERV